MRVLFWNIRGLGKLARVRQLKELVANEKVDIIGIQETIKQTFSPHDLDSLAPRGMFSWNLDSIQRALRRNSGGSQRGHPAS